MKMVYEPEIPVNIVDPELIYYCNAKSVGAWLRHGFCYSKRYQKTYPPGIAGVDVEVVLDPSWSRDMMRNYTNCS